MILDLENLSIEKKEQHEQLQKKLTMLQASSEALAAHVVLYKTLGLYKNIAILCMQELARRRSYLGEEFNYESFIDDQCKKITQIQPLNLNTMQALFNVKQLTNLIK